MSQIHIFSFPHNMNQSIQDSKLILIGKYKETVSYRKIIFPKETHFKKEVETKYEEFSKSYSVVEILKGDGKVKVGDVIKVWEEPSYKVSAMKAYHEQGLLESPAERHATPVYPIQNEQEILFLTPYQEIWTFVSGSVSEGIQGRDKVKENLSEI